MPKVRDIVRLLERDGWRLVRTPGSHPCSSTLTSRE